VFKDAPYNRGLLYERDDFRSDAAFILSSALRTLQGIDVPDLLQENCPLLSSALGV